MIKMHPVISSLRHHKLTVLLLILQVALTCAMVCNVLFMVAGRMAQLNLPSGVDEGSLSVIQNEVIGKGVNVQARQDEDLAGLRAIHGVAAAVAVDSLPFGGGESSYGTCATAEDMANAVAVRSMMGSGFCVQPAVYGGSPGEIAALGLRIVAGRDFQIGEYATGSNVPVAIITRELAVRLYPGKSALGQSIYTGSAKPIRVIGIVDTLLRPRLRDAAVNQFAMLFPMLPNDSHITYLLHSAPEDRQRILRDAVAKLDQLEPNRIIPPGFAQTFTQMRADYFQRDSTMIELLLASALGLLFVTALGITGLANFWVQQRTRQIGIRRAIGATRGDTLRYFQSENFLIVSVGIAVGLLLAIGLNLMLMKNYELPRLPLYYLPISAVVLWLLGQLAVLGPALRAAAVPPVVATRAG